jgi:hypothetical protein
MTHHNRTYLKIESPPELRGGRDPGSAGPSNLCNNQRCMETTSSSAEGKRVEIQF